MRHENRHDSVITNRTTPQLHLNDLVFIIMFEKKRAKTTFLSLTNKTSNWSKDVELVKLTIIDALIVITDTGLQGRCIDTVAVKMSNTVQ